MRNLIKGFSKSVYITSICPPCSRSFVHLSNTLGGNLQCSSAGNPGTSTTQTIGKSFRKKQLLRCLRYILQPMQYKLLLITNRKLHMSFRLVPINSVTLNEIGSMKEHTQEHRNSYWLSTKCVLASHQSSVRSWLVQPTKKLSSGKVFRIGTVRYNWPMSAHASQAFSIAHCTDSEDLPSSAVRQNPPDSLTRSRTPCCIRFLIWIILW